jgi:hypothetical protein
MVPEPESPVTEAETVVRSVDERRLSLGDLRLERIALLLRQPTGGDGGVDLVVESLLEGGRERTGSHM